MAEVMPLQERIGREISLVSMRMLIGDLNDELITKADGRSPEPPAPPLGLRFCIA